MNHNNNNNNNVKPIDFSVGCRYCKRTTIKSEPCTVTDCGVADLCLVCSKNNTITHNSNCNYYPHPKAAIVVVEKIN